MREIDEIVRYERGPGEVACAIDLPGIGAVVIVGPTSVGTPVWPPEELAAHGVSTEMRRVTAASRCACPREGCRRAAMHYEMSGGDGLFCIECPEHAFQWGLKGREP